MNIKQAYDNWASQYDTNPNKTRDLEGNALRLTLSNIDFDHCLEIGCGTGKNTVWLAEKTKELLSVDFSQEMLARANAKINSNHVQFKQADITRPWEFGKDKFDLVSFSLVLEHIEDLDPVFKEAAAALKSGGHVYIGELHPFKQYSGSKARFETESGEQIVTCFDHHVSEFTGLAKKHGFAIELLNEYFDNDDRKEIPRILVLLLKKILGVKIKK
ncbi:MAG: class I SAM-dependent methyltransferase [Ferruginibacter sp.]